MLKIIFSGHCKSFKITVVFLMLALTSFAQKAFFCVHDSSGALANVTITNSLERYYVSDNAGRVYPAEINTSLIISHVGYNTADFLFVKTGDTVFLQKKIITETAVNIHSNYKFSRKNYYNGNFKINKRYHLYSLVKQRVGLLFTNEHPEETSVLRKFSFIISNAKEINRRKGIIEFKFYSLHNGRITKLLNAASISLPINKLKHKNEIAISEKIFMPDEQILITMLFVDTDDPNAVIPFKFSGIQNKSCSMLNFLPFSDDKIISLDILKYCAKMRIPQYASSFMSVPAQIMYTPIIY